MPLTSTKRRNIMIATVIIVVLVISLVASLIIFYYYQPTSNQLTEKLSVNVSLNQTEAIQGNNLQAQVNVTTIGEAENITLSSNNGSSGINCIFEPDYDTSNFTSTLTMAIPNSTITGNYNVTVTASSNGQVKNASFSVSILSANVTVSGKADISFFAGVGVSSLSGIQFTDIQTGSKTSFSFPFISPPIVTNDIGEYSVNLLNEHTYNVTLEYYWGVPNANIPLTTRYIGNFTVYASVGEKTISKDFVLNQS